MTREDGKKGKNNTHPTTHAQTRQPRPGALRSNLLRIDDALFPSSSLSLSHFFDETTRFISPGHTAAVRKNERVLFSLCFFDFCFFGVLA